MVKAELQHPGGISFLPLRPANAVPYMASKLGKVVVELVANIDHSDKKAILTDCKQGGGGNPTFGDGFLFRVFLL